MTEQQRLPEEQANEQPQNGEGTNTYGFQPLQQTVPEQRKELQTLGCITLRAEINKMLSRYPQLELRTSAETMQRLEQYDEKELENILQNCRNDLQNIRGTPSADFALFVTTGPVDHYLLPGFTERCVNDADLKEDVEHEMTMLFGSHSNRINILYRLLNNAYACLFHPDIPYNTRTEVEVRNKSAYTRTIPPVNEKEYEQEEQTHRQCKRARHQRGEDSSSD